jgi:tetraprenyl-beta-curcumene synthase
LSFHRLEQEAASRPRLANPTPLTVSQVGALLAVATRELTWVLPNVAREVRSWQQRALQIPDAQLREDALTTLTRERLNSEGAALFTVLPRRRDPELLRLVVAYQVLLDYLDTISERPAPDPLANGHQLHQALSEALDPFGPVSDYYEHHPSRDDGGYLQALIEACRCGCLTLPGFARVRARAMQAGRRAAVQILNHDPIPDRRDAALAAWAAREFADESDVSWFELTAAASSSLWIHALLALAADPAVSDQDLVQAESAYLPWICAASTLLDSFVDQADDAATGNHNYLEHYVNAEMAGGRLREIVYQSAARARGLRRGTRHALIATGMVAMYLSKDCASEGELRPIGEGILLAAGSLPRAQLPIMSAMRAARGLRAA